MAVPPLPPDDAVAIRKAALRSHARAARAALTAAERAGASALICADLQALAAQRGARRIGVYAATATEVDVRAAAAAWLAAGLLVAYPRVDGPETMTFRLVAAVPDEAAGRFGLREPSADAPAVEDLDLLIVPGVAFDREGWRLGQGGGYYDRWLESAEVPFTVGVAFVAQLAAAVPRAPHDVAVDAVLTEDGMYR